MADIAVILLDQRPTAYKARPQRRKVLTPIVKIRKTVPTKDCLADTIPSSGQSSAKAGSESGAVPASVIASITSRGGGSPGLATAPRSRQMLIARAFLGHQHLASIGGYKSTDPALSDLGCDRSVRGLYAHPAIFLRASPPVPSRNILRARAIPLSAVPEVEALPDPPAPRKTITAIATRKSTR